MSAEDSDNGRHENGHADESGLQRTRTRVSRACTRCRNRKDKCDGGRPSCSTCLSADQPCSYEPSTKKRGLPEGYVRGMEKLWAVLVAKIDGLEHAVTQILDDNRDDLCQVWNHRQTGEELHTMWKDSKVLHELETLLAAVDNASAHGAKRKRDREEQDANVQENSPELGNILSHVYSVHFTPNASNARPSSSGQKQSVGPSTHPEKITLPPAASHLLGQYFRFTHCWLPILDRPFTLRRCYEMSREPIELSSANSDLALLAAALAYGSRLGQNGSRLNDSSIQINGLEMVEISRRCLPAAHGKFDLGHIQALLILVLIDIGDSKWNTAWQSVGLAVRALQEAPENMSPPSKSYLATQQLSFVLDTLLALRLGHRPQLSAEDITTTGLLPEDGHEEWEPWSAPDFVSFYSIEPAFTISCFNRVTKIFMVLNDFLRKQAAYVRVAPQQGVAETLQLLQALAEEDPSQSEDSAPRPPHQLWLKALHLSVCAVVAAPEPERKHFVLRCLDSLSDILQTWSRSSSIGLTAMPTFLFALLHCIFTPLFRDLSSDPASVALATNPFGLGLLADRLDEAGTAWLEAIKVATTLRAHLGRRASDLLGTSDNRSTKRLKRPTYPLDPTQTQQGSLNLWPPDPFNQSFADMPSMTSQASNLPRQRLEEAKFGQLETPVASSFDTMHADSMSGVQGGTDAINTDHASRTHNPSIATSPSFQGDEIDALFQEMAQLDTTEWATGRSQGLRDFGFQDDMTFEAFCNDPDRLYSSNGLHNQQDAGAGQPSTFPYDPNLFMPQPRPLNNFDPMNVGWDG